MNKFIKPLFWVGGVYDFVLGLAFLLIPCVIFELINVTPPNHTGYVQFSAAFLIVFSFMLFNVALKPVENRNLIPYAAMMKIAYCTVVGGHYILGNMPFPWVIFAIADVFFLLAFIWAYKEIEESVNIQ